MGVASKTGTTGSRHEGEIERGVEKESGKRRSDQGTNQFVLYCSVSCRLNVYCCSQPDMLVGGGRCGVFDLFARFSVRTLFTESPDPPLQFVRQIY